MCSLLIFRLTKQGEYEVGWKLNLVVSVHEFNGEPCILLVHEGDLPITEDRVVLITILVYGSRIIGIVPLPRVFKVDLLTNIATVVHLSSPVLVGLHEFLIGIEVDRIRNLSLERDRFRINEDLETIMWRAEMITVKNRLDIVKIIGKRIPMTDVLSPHQSEVAIIVLVIDGNKVRNVLILNRNALKSVVWVDHACILSEEIVVVNAIIGNRSTLVDVLFKSLKIIVNLTNLVRCLIEKVEILNRRLIRVIIEYSHTQQIQICRKNERMPINGNLRTIEVHLVKKDSLLANNEPRIRNHTIVLFGFDGDALVIEEILDCLKSLFAGFEFTRKNLLVFDVKASTESGVSIAHSCL